MAAYKTIVKMIALLATSGLVLAGCERKERVLDVETPGADVEVERSLDDGDVDVLIDER